MQYRPLFNDAGVHSGKAYFYRIVAVNEVGKSPPSNSVGPVPAKCRTLVDECGDLHAVAASEGPVAPSKGKDRRRREDVSRLAISPGGRVTYEVPAAIVRWSTIAFHERPTARLVVECSPDGKNYLPVPGRATVLVEAAGDYGYLPATRFDSAEIPRGARFLRFTAPTEPQDAAGEVELSRVEIGYEG